MIGKQTKNVNKKALTLVHGLSNDQIRLKNR